MINFQTISKRTLRRILPRSRFVRSVSVLAGSTAASQALLILASPLLTRLYSPDDFGLLAVFAALLGVVGVLASLRYQLAIPLPESDHEAAHVAVAGLVAVLFTAMVSVLVVALFGDAVAHVVGAPDLAPYMWLLPVGVLALGIYQVFKYWSIRTRAFTEVAKSNLTQSVSLVAVQLGAFALGPLALLVGQVAGQSAGATRLSVLGLRDRSDAFRKVRLSGIWKAAIRYRDFPIYSTWGAIFNKAGSQLPPVLFAALFNPAAAGIYFLAHRVLAMPMQLIGRAIADVFMSDAAEAKRNGLLSKLVINLHTKLATIAVPPALVLVLTGPELFEIAFGGDWRNAGVFAQWMTPWVYLVFVTSPLSTVFSVLEKQGQEMVFQFILLTSRVASLFLGAMIGDLTAAVALFALTSAVCWAGLLVWLMKAAKVRWIQFGESTKGAMMWGLPVGLPFIGYIAVGGGAILWVLALVLTVSIATMRYFKLIRDVS